VAELNLVQLLGQFADFHGVVVLLVILHVPAVSHGLALDARFPHGDVMLLRGAFLGCHNFDWHLRRFGFRWFLDCDGHSILWI